MDQPSKANRTQQPEPRGTIRLLGLETTRFDIALAALSLLLLISSIWMMLSSAWYPFQDLGAHIEIFDVVGRFHSDATTHDIYYERPFVFAPNMLTMWLARILVPLVGAKFFANGLAVLSVVLLPLSIAYLCRVVGRTPWLGIFGFALAHNSMLYFGLINWTLALPLFFVLIALALEVSAGAGWKHRVALAVLLAMTFLVHGLLWAISIPTVGLVLLLRWRSALDFRDDLVTVLPAFLILVPWLLDRETSGRSFGPRFESVLAHIEQMHHDALGVINGTLDNWVSIILLCAAVCLILFSWAPEESDTEEASRSPVKNHGLAAAAVAIGLGYLLLPSHFDLFSIVNQRLLIPLLGLAVALIPLRRVDLRSSFVLFVVAVTTLVFHADLTNRFKSFNEEFAGPLREVVEEIPQGAGLSVSGPWHHDAVRNWMQHTARGMHAVVNGGFSNGGFAAAPTITVEYATNQIPAVPTGSGWTDDDLAQLPYILTYKLADRSRAERDERLELFAEAEPWAVFKARTDELEPSRFRMIGGRGGHFEELRCPNAVVSSLRVRVASNDEIDGLALQCADGHSSHAGRSSGTPDASLGCGADSVAGLYGRANENIVTGIGIICRRADGTLRRTAFVGDQGASGFRYVCNEDEVFDGIDVRTGIRVDAVSIHCSSPQPTGGSEEVEAAPTGGEEAPSDVTEADAGP